MKSTYKWLQDENRILNKTDWFPILFTTEINTSLMSLLDKNIPGISSNITNEEFDNYNKNNIVSCLFPYQNNTDCHSYTEYLCDILKQINPTFHSQNPIEYILFSNQLQLLFENHNNKYPLLIGSMFYNSFILYNEYSNNFILDFKYSRIQPDIYSSIHSWIINNNKIDNILSRINKNYLSSDLYNNSIINIWNDIHDMRYKSHLSIQDNTVIPNDRNISHYQTFINNAPINKFLLNTNIYGRYIDHPYLFNPILLKLYNTESDFYKLYYKYMIKSFVHDFSLTLTNNYKSATVSV